MECTIQGVPVYYEEYGSGTPILMLHGCSPDHRLMTGCMEPIFERTTGYRRIYPDLPGMGKTPGRMDGATSDKVLELLMEFVKTIIPEQRFLLAGESYGGYLSLGMLKKMGERIQGAALICPSVEPVMDKRILPKRRIFGTNGELDRKYAVEDVCDFRQVAVIETEENFLRFREDILPGLRLGDKCFMTELGKPESRIFSDMYFVDSPTTIHTGPALILTGRQDHIVGYEDTWRILAGFPRGSFAVLDIAGHNLQIDQEGLFCALVDEWLSRVAAEESKR